MVEGVGELSRVRDSLCGAGGRPEASEQAMHARLECALAGLWFRLGDFTRSEAHARPALDLAHQAGDAHNAMVVLNTLGLTLWQTARLDEAASCFEAALARARIESDAATIGTLNSNLAIVERMRGRVGRSMRLNRQVLKAARAAGNTYGAMLATHNLGDLYNLRREWLTATRHFNEALELARATGYTGYVPYFLVNLAEASLGRRAFDECARHADEALEAARAQGDQHCEVTALGVAARLALERGDLDRADGLVRLALKGARTARVESLVRAVVGVYGQLLAARKQRARAAAVFQALVRHSLVVPAERAEIEARLARLDLNKQEAAAACDAAARTSIDRLADAIEFAGQPATGAA
jgi:tetratricopeptide (TPR) repeat protein